MHLTSLQKEPATCHFATYCSADHSAQSSSQIIQLICIKGIYSLLILSDVIMLLIAYGVFFFFFSRKEYNGSTIQNKC